MHNTLFAKRLVIIEQVNLADNVNRLEERSENVEIMRNRGE